MMRVSLFALVGLASARANNNVARRLQGEQLVQLHRRNVIDDITEPFEDLWIDIEEDFLVPVGDVFKDGWDEVDTWFSTDFVNWWEDDFVNAMEFIFYPWIEGGKLMVDKDTYIEIGEDVFIPMWNGIVKGLEAGWDWTKTAGVDAWEWTEDTWNKMGCMVESWTGSSCIKCVKDQCNESLSEETIKQIDSANGVAIMTMEDQFDPFLNGCATAMSRCPTQNDCKELALLPESTKKFVASSIAKCNLCYQCLPYGSTTETCQKALDQVMPNNCEGCSKSQNAMYKSFYSCSSIEQIVEGVEKLGESYMPGGQARDGLNNLCKYCANCSSYTGELRKTCGDWRTISAPVEEGGWDYLPPVVPSALFPGEGSTVEGSTVEGSARRL